MNNKKILLLAVIFFWFAQYVYIPFQTPYLTSIQVSSSMIGTIVGAYGISQMLLRLPVGVLADKQDRHKILIMIGGISAGIASLFRIVVGGGTGFLIANLFSGLASAMWISFMVLFMRFYDENHQQEATSSIILCNNLGMLVGFITSTLFYEKLGMNIICAFSVISGLLSAIIASFLKYEKLETKQVTVRDLISVCNKKNLIVFSLLALIQQAIQMSTTMSFTSQIINSLSNSSMLVGIGSIIYMISSVIFAKVAASKFCTSKGPKVFIPLCFITTSLYCILVPNMTSVYVVLCLQILPGLSTGILFTYLTSEAMVGVEPYRKSTAMGFYQAVYALGMSIAPMICGKILAAYSMSYAYYFLAVLCIVAFIISLTFYKTNKHVH